MNKPKNSEIKLYKELLKRMDLAHLIPKLSKHKHFWSDTIDSDVVFQITCSDYSISEDVFETLKIHLSGHSESRTDKKQHYFSYMNIFVHWPNISHGVRKYFSSKTKVYQEFREREHMIGEVYDDAIERWGNMMALILNDFSDCRTAFYTLGFSYLEKRVPGDLHKKIVEISIGMQKSKKRTVTLDGQKRTIYRPFANSTWNYSFEPNVYLDGFEFEVYIQGHALERLEQRLDSLNNRYSLNLIPIAVEHCELIEFNGLLLAPYVIRGDCLGYFVCEIVNDYCLFKTFLFITHDKTPEGEILNKRLDLNRYDKSYLRLDRLSHFTHSDLKEDRELCEIIDQCGLSHLFNLKVSLKDLKKSENAEYLHSSLLN